MAAPRASPTISGDDSLRRRRSLIGRLRPGRHDRDSKFTDLFKRVLADSGVEVALTPPQAPNCTAYAERFVLSIKSECIRRMLLFGEAFLRRAVAECVAHYLEKLAHQGIGNERIERRDTVGEGEVVCDERLGGLLKRYRRAA